MSTSFATWTWRTTSSLYVFVAAVESLLCSRMADCLVDNRGLPYNPNKGLWGPGLVQMIVPLRRARAGPPKRSTRLTDGDSGR